jgi:hypothetical protein
LEGADQAKYCQRLQEPRMSPGKTRRRPREDRRRAVDALAGVHADPVDPGVIPRVLLETFRLPYDREEDVLRRFLGVVPIHQDRHGEAIHLLMVSVEEGFDCGRCIQPVIGKERRVFRAQPVCSARPVANPESPFSANPLRRDTVIPFSDLRYRLLSETRGVVPHLHRHPEPTGGLIRTFKHPCLP